VEVDAPGVVPELVAENGQVLGRQSDDDDVVGLEPGVDVVEDAGEEGVVVTVEEGGVLEARGGIPTMPTDGVRRPHPRPAWKPPRTWP
jgi:hypothetical protein